MTAHVFYLELQLLLRTLLGSLFHHQFSVLSQLQIASPYLEGKVLQEMCGAIGLVRLRATSGIDPHTNCRGLRPRRVLGSDLQTGQLLL